MQCSRVSREGAVKNICNALNEQFYEQLTERPTLMYKRVMITDYFTNARRNWIFLDKTIEIKAIEKYKRPWEYNKHLTAFILQLNRKHTKLLNDTDIVITNADKNHNFMTQMWTRSNVFGEKVMEK